MQRPHVCSSLSLRFRKYNDLVPQKFQANKHPTSIHHAHLPAPLTLPPNKNHLLPYGITKGRTNLFEKFTFCLKITF